MAYEAGRQLPYLQEAILALRKAPPAYNRDTDIRRLVPFVQRVARCKREVAIEFLCKMSRFERNVLYSLRSLQTLNKDRKPRQPKTVSMAAAMDAIALDVAAWSKPR